VRVKTVAGIGKWADLGRFYLGPPLADQQTVRFILVVEGIDNGIQI
jgi:hypothetical protein